MINNNDNNNVIIMIMIMILIIIIMIAYNALYNKSPLLESQVKSSQKYSSCESSQVIAIFFKSSQVKSNNFFLQVSMV